MVIYFLLGLLSGWTALFFVFLLFVYKADQKNKQDYKDMISNLYSSYQEYLNIEDLRKFKS